MADKYTGMMEYLGGLTREAAKKLKEHEMKTKQMIDGMKAEQDKQANIKRNKP